uniref:F-box domain-containing protein n=1 Tax=Ditylenchus dipsaci TaxID=166011 RepID=A0A915D1Y4_9BILA
MKLTAGDEPVVNRKPSGIRVSNELLTEVLNYMSRKMLCKSAQLLSADTAETIKRNFHVVRRQCRLIKRRIKNSHPSQQLGHMWQRHFLKRKTNVPAFFEKIKKIFRYSKQACSFVVTLKMDHLELFELSNEQTGEQLRLFIEPHSHRPVYRLSVSNEVLTEVLSYMSRKMLCKSAQLVNKQFFRIANSHISCLYLIPEIAIEYGQEPGVLVNSERLVDRQPNEMNCCILPFII